MQRLPYLLAFIAGVTTALQVGVNSRAREWLRLEHPLQGALVNFGGGTIVLLAIWTVARFPWPSLTVVGQAPWWIWTGGLLGILYVSASVYLGPKLGVTLFLTIVVAGQVIGALAVDHFGLLGMPFRSITPGRVAGVMMVLAGMVVVYFSTE